MNLTKSKNFYHIKSIRSNQINAIKSNWSNQIDQIKSISDRTTNQSSDRECVGPVSRTPRTATTVWSVDLDMELLLRTVNRRLTRPRSCIRLRLLFCSLLTNKTQANQSPTNCSSAHYSHTRHMLINHQSISQSLDKWFDRSINQSPINQAINLNQSITKQSID